jgi:hypothetical protein
MAGCSTSFTSRAANKRIPARCAAADRLIGRRCHFCRPSRARHAGIAQSLQNMLKICRAASILMFSDHIPLTRSH